MAKTGPDSTIALIVAAGSSERMGGDIPKPYLEVDGKALLAHTVSIFLSHPGIDGVRVVARRKDHGRYRKAMQDLTLFPLVVGGATRQESVRRGLEALRHVGPKYVLVHDAARASVSHALIDRVLAGLIKNDAVIPGIPVTDTLKQAEAGVISRTVPRENLYAVQTPQGFDYTKLLAAHEECKGQALTDDAAVMEAAGHRVTLIEGDPDNFKITTPHDIEKFMATMKHETRTGMGFDVHALKPGNERELKLCGIAIPHTHHLEGHSDADVGLHAIVDALLGTLAEGDIGSHFPPSDSQWKGADSERFLLHAFELLTARGGKIIHLDVTIICEQPKIGPHREKMREHIAALLKLPVHRISVKATTTEKLGFTGRGEGIAAQAVATITLPEQL